MKPNKTIIIGLTGNSGSGKSEVSKILAKEGAKIIDADKIAHEVLMPGGPAYREVLDLFGQEILMPDGRLDRKKIASIVFNDGEILKKHTEITHKHIIKITRDMLCGYTSAQTEVVVLDAPLLIEANLHAECDFIWLVAAGFGKKASRITERDGLTLEQARRRLAAQSSQDELMNYAGFIIYNDGSLEELRKTVISEFNKIKDMI